MLCTAVSMTQIVDEVQQAIHIIHQTALSRGSRLVSDIHACFHILNRVKRLKEKPLVELPTERHLPYGSHNVTCHLN